MSKKFIFIIIGAVILILIIVIAVSSKRRAPAPAPTAPPPTPPLTQEERKRLFPSEEREVPPQATEIAKRLKIEKTLDLKAQAPTAALEGDKIVYFDKKTGEFYSASTSGTNITPLTQAGLKDVQKIVWSPRKDKAILYFPAEKNTYDLIEKSQTPLDEHITVATFSPDGSKILYKYDSDKSHALVQADPDGSNWKKIKDVGPGNLVIHWYKSDRIAYFSPPSGYSRSTIYTCDLNGKNMKIIASDNYGSNAKWSPDGSKMIFTTSPKESSSLILRLANGDGSDIRNLQMNTLVEKCTFSSDSKTLYCAIPEPISARFVLPDDWYDKKVITSDSFWQIDTETMERTRIASVSDIETLYGKTFDASDLFISSDGTRLFFTARNDGKLYSLILP